jgi:cell division protein ZipA
MRGVLSMMSQLRWTLLILGVIFIAALAWWERRRPRQASGTLERAAPREPPPGAPARAVRDPPLTLPEIRVRDPLPAHELSVMDLTREPPRVPVPASAAAAAAEEEEEMAAIAHAGAAGRDPPPQAPAAAEAAAVAPALPRESLPELPAAPPLLVEWPPERQRRILALRLVAPRPERFAGRSVRQALAAEGFVLGQFAIFHKPDDERRAVLSAASLSRPGTFDMETMDSQHYGGLSLFAVLPGPKSPPQAFDELVFAARNLNERLQGVLQDEQGSPLTPARIATLREQLRAGAAS